MTELKHIVPIFQLRHDHFTYILNHTDNDRKKQIKQLIIPLNKINGDKGTVH